MSLTKTTDADGRVTGVSGEHVVLTGEIRGTVTLPDGTVVDVTDPVVSADSVERAAQIAHAVACRYAAEGHPTDPGFTYVEGN